MRSGRALLDSYRRGMSFAMEVRLLTELELGTGSLVSRSPFTELTEAQKSQLSVNLKGDLLELPARPSLHIEWQEVTLRELPGCLRHSWSQQDQDSLDHPWLTSLSPTLSGRLRRCHSPELGSLALMAPVAQLEVTRRMVEVSVATLVRGMGRRERLSALSVLGAKWAERMNGASSPLLKKERAIREAVIARTHSALVRSSRSTTSPERLFNRIKVHLMAAAFGPEHWMEANAVAVTWPLSDGRRLLRYLKKRQKGEKALESLLLSCIGGSSEPMVSERT